MKNCKTVCSPCGGRSVGGSHKPHHGPAADHAHHHAEEQFVVVVHLEHHAAAAHRATQQNGTAQPARGVEAKDERKGHKHADHPTRSGGVGRNLDPHVGQRTNNLDEQRRHDDRRDEVGNAEEFHQPIECTVAHDVHNVGHKSPFAVAHLVTRPAVEVAVEINCREREHPREEHHDAAEGQPIAEVNLIEIAEHQQQGDSHRGEVEGIEEPRNGFGREQGILVGEIPVRVVGIAGGIGTEIEIGHR